MLFALRLAARAPAKAMALVVGCGLFVCQDERSAGAAPTEPMAVPKAKVSKAYGYYVDFRAMDAVLYGHTYIAYGRLGVRGRPINVRYAGFEPNGGLIAGVIGHIAPVSGSIMTSKESVNFETIDSYRRKLTPQQYRSLVAAVETAKRHPSNWNVVFQNCNDFVGAMAHTVGLKAPSNMVLPYVYVAALHSLNN